MERNNLEQIIKYWSSAGLSSLNSSTTNSDPFLAGIDNSIECSILNDLISGKRVLRCLDIGAGYGRFTPVFLRNCESITLLELTERWGGCAECIPVSFEDYSFSLVYDLILASGVLYLYNDIMMDAFFKKVSSLQSAGDKLLVRDFVSNVNLKMPSGFVSGGECYYRTIDWWRDYSLNYGYSLVSFQRSKPHLDILRKPRFRKLVRIGRLQFMFQNCFSYWVMKKFGNFQMGVKQTDTVFLAFQRL